MRRRKSPLLITMGILCIVAGAFGLTCGGCGIAGGVLTLSLSSRPGNPAADLFSFLDSRAPYWRVVEVGKPIIHLLISLAFIGAGIALICRKHWGRWTAIIFAVISIPLHIGYAAYELAVLAPAQAAFYRTSGLSPGGPAASPGFAQGFALGTKIGVIIGAVFWCLIALALLIGMLVPAAAEALAPERRQRLHGDFDDEFEDERVDRRYDDDEREDNRYDDG